MNSNGGVVVAFELNRIDGMSVLSQLRLENVSFVGSKAMIKLQFLEAYGFEKHDMEILFPAGDGKIAAWFELAADFLTHLRSIDNEVQRVSAEQWRKATSSHPSSYYEGELAYVTLAEPAEATLRYWVIGCNSEWDEHFVRLPDGWKRLEKET